jgi:hypothetical protein
MQHMCAYEVDFPFENGLTLLLIYALLRPLLSATVNSVSYLPRKSGRDSTTRECILSNPACLIDTFFLG